MSYTTSNCAVLCELGRLPLSVVYKYKYITFWITLFVNATDIRLRNSLYTMLKEFDDSVKYMLYSYGFGDVWVQQGVGNVVLFLTMIYW
jgi:hypothetical protein